MSFYLIRSKSKLRYVPHGMFLRIIVTKFSWKQKVLCGGKQLEDNKFELLVCLADYYCEDFLGGGKAQLSHS